MTELMQEGHHRELARQNNSMLVSNVVAATATPPVQVLEIHFWSGYPAGQSKSFGQLLDLLQGQIPAPRPRSSAS